MRCKKCGSTLTIREHRKASCVLELPCYPGDSKPVFQLKDIKDEENSEIIGYELVGCPHINVLFCSDWDFMVRQIKSAVERGEIELFPDPIATHNFRGETVIENYPLHVVIEELVERSMEEDTPEEEKKILKILAEMPKDHFIQICRAMAMQMETEADEAMDPRDKYRWEVYVEKLAEKYGLLLG